MITPSAPGQPAAPSSELLLLALAKLLRPLVRLLIQRGVTFPALADLLRGLYVEVAKRDLLADPKARTDSRVSLLTGVHRKEIRRQRIPANEAEPAFLTLSSQVIARWLGTPAFTDWDGKPLPLPRLGPAPSFEALVAGVTKDVRSRALLDEWLDGGIAVLDDAGQVWLEQAAFLPKNGGEQQAYYFARNLHDHIAAAAANMVASGAGPFVDRSVHYDGLSAEAAARLAAVARTAAEGVLLGVNRTAIEVSDADDAAAAVGQPRRHRVNLGVYLYLEEERPAGEG